MAMISTRGTDAGSCGNTMRSSVMSFGSSGTALGTPAFFAVFEAFSGFDCSAAATTLGSPVALESPLLESATSLLVASLAFCVLAELSDFFVAGAFPWVFGPVSVAPASGLVKSESGIRSFPGGAGEVLRSLFCGTAIVATPATPPLSGVGLVA